MKNKASRSAGSSITKNNGGKLLPHNGQKFELQQRAEKTGLVISHILNGLEIHLTKIFEAD